MPERDPRKDPRPGDVLETKGAGIEVTMRTGDSIRFLHRGLSGPPINRMPMNCKSTLRDWRKWSKDSEVIHAAD